MINMVELDNQFNPLNKIVLDKGKIHLDLDLSFRI